MVKKHGPALWVGEPGIVPIRPSWSWVIMRNFATVHLNGETGWMLTDVEFSSFLGLISLSWSVVNPIYLLSRRYIIAPNLFAIGQKAREEMWNVRCVDNFWSYFPRHINTSINERISIPLSGEITMRGDNECSVVQCSASWLTAVAIDLMWINRRHRRILDEASP